MDYERNFDEVSKLIDALPEGYAELRAKRDKLRPLVTQNHEKLSAFAGGQPNEAATVNEATDLGTATLELDMETIRFGDEAMTSADETLQKQKRSIDSLGVGVTVLVSLAAVLGLVAAFWGVKFEGGAD